MSRLTQMALALWIMLSAAWTIRIIQSPNHTVASPAVNCAAVTFDLHPGLHPTLKRFPFRPAPDAPRGKHTVSLPLYPGVVPLSSYVASPFSNYTADPYLQTASAEYLSTDGQSKVRAGLATIFAGCGWKRQGFWTTNASFFADGDTFVSNANPELSVDLSYADSLSGGTDIGYGVEEIIYPRRPPSSYLHGPFVQVRISLGRATIQNGEPVPHYVHATVLARSAIVRLVSAINSLKGRRTVFPICSGGLSLVGPMWLAFIRRDGSVQHAYETLWGPCGGLAVNGVRGLLDTGIVWKQIIALTGGRG